METATAAVARRTETVKLSAPVEWFNKTITEVSIEEPSAAMFFEYGLPQQFVGSPNGQSGLIMDNGDILLAYVRRCMKIEQGDVLLRMLSLADGFAIKRALMGFFQDAPEKTSS